MHFSIAAIVYGKTEKAATKQAEEVFGRLSCKECSRPFDYWSIIDGPHKVGSKEGQKIISDSMAWTKSEFMANIKRLRAAIAKHTDEQAYQQYHAKIDEDIRFLGYSIGRYKGPDIYIYDNDGEGIRHPEHLRNAIEKWPDLCGETRKRLNEAGEVWVVQADAHA